MDKAVGSSDDSKCVTIALPKSCPDNQSNVCPHCGSKSVSHIVPIVERSYKYTSHRSANLLSYCSSISFAHD